MCRRFTVSVAFQYVADGNCGDRRVEHSGLTLNHAEVRLATMPYRTHHTIAYKCVWVHVCVSVYGLANRAKRDFTHYRAQKRQKCHASDPSLSSFTFILPLSTSLLCLEHNASFDAVISPLRSSSVFRS